MTITDITPEQLAVPPLTELRRMSDADLLAYAEESGDDCAWDEISERGCDRQFNESWRGEA